MFNGNFRHPLDNLIRDDRLFMLEAIIPFVDDRMKAPLAMYIKIMELQSILSALSNKDYVNSCGLCKDLNNQDDILSSLAGCGFSDIKEQFTNMKKAMDMMEMMNSMNASGDMASDHTKNMFDDLYQHYGSYNGQEPESSPYPQPEADSDYSNTSDLYGSIKDLFDEYDNNNL